MHFYRFDCKANWQIFGFVWVSVALFESAKYNWKQHTKNHLTYLIIYVEFHAFLPVCENWDFQSVPLIHTLEKFTLVQKNPKLFSTFKSSLHRYNLRDRNTFSLPRFRFIEPLFTKISPPLFVLTCLMLSPLPLDLNTD